MRSAIVSRQILALAEDATVLYQQSPGEYTEDGYVVPGGYVSFPIDAVVAQPPSEAIVARVTQEGTRVAGAMTFYVTGDVNVAPLRTGALPTEAGTLSVTRASTIA